ncbi:hypothetical protein LDENG_00051630 [Lucifuga dentata]|nr:hypothetical protein LDENG_00051630 [Lucifuga dentata]
MAFNCLNEWLDGSECVLLLLAGVEADGPGIRIKRKGGKMRLYLKITAGFLLLAQAFHLALLQNSTDSPVPTIPQSWLRNERVKNTAGSGNAPAEDNAAEVEEPDGPDIVSSDDGMDGIPDSIPPFSGEDDAAQDGDTNETFSGVNAVPVPPEFPNDTMPHKSPQATVSPNSATTNSTHSTQTNLTVAEEEFQNFTLVPQAPTTQNSIRGPDDTDLHETNSESNTTEKSTPDPVTGLTNRTDLTTNETIETNPESKATTEASPVTAVAPGTPEEANMTDKDAASGSSERGLASELQNNKRNEAWGAFLGTSVALALVGLVVYIILKKKKQKDFSHRKLVEEFHADPVLRLDNSEPLDLNYGGSAYYNPGLQGDNIQMTNIPGSYRP